MTFRNASKFRAEPTDAERVSYDERRTRFIEKQGFRVMRFRNPDVLRDRDSVIESILARLESSPSPGAADAAPPSLQRGEGFS